MTQVIDASMFSLVGVIAYVLSLYLVSREADKAT